MSKETVEQMREDIAQILRDNITASPQLDTFVIHGAITKIIEYFAALSNPPQRTDDELWDDLVAEMVTFTGAAKMESVRLCEDLKGRGWKIITQKTE